MAYYSFNPPPPFEDPFLKNAVASDLMIDLQFIENCSSSIIFHIIIHIYITYMNRYIITWMLHQILMYSNKAILAAG